MYKYKSNNACGLGMDIVFTLLNITARRYIHHLSKLRSNTISGVQYQIYRP